MTESKKLMMLRFMELGGCRMVPKLTSIIANLLSFSLSLCLICCLSLKQAEESRVTGIMETGEPLIADSLRSLCGPHSGGCTVQEMDQWGGLSDCASFRRVAGQPDRLICTGTDEPHQLEPTQRFEVDSRSYEPINQAPEASVAELLDLMGGPEAKQAQGQEEQQQRDSRQARGLDCEDWGDGCPSRANERLRRQQLVGGPPEPKWRHGGGRTESADHNAASEIRWLLEAVRQHGVSLSRGLIGTPLILHRVGPTRMHRSELKDGAVGPSGGRNRQSEFRAIAALPMRWPRMNDTAEAGEFEREVASQASASGQPTTEELLLPTISPLEAGADMEPKEQQALECKLHRYTYRAVKSDGKGSSCSGIVEATICYGGCDTGEIADWQFPHKKSTHTVCSHGTRRRAFTRLTNCRGPAVSEELQNYHYVNAGSCRCQKCTSADTTCSGGLSTPAISDAREAKAKEQAALVLARGPNSSDLASSAHRLLRALDQ